MAERDSKGRFVGAADGLAKVTGAAKGASDGLAGVTAGLAGTSAGSDRATSGLSKIWDGLKRMAGGAAEGEGALGAVTGALSALGPEGEAVAKALELIVAVMTVVISTMYELVTAAIEVTEAQEEMIATFAALGAGGEEGGAAALKAVEALAAELPFTTAQIGAMAKSLMTAGLQGAALEQAVRAVAAATAIMGDSGGRAADTLIKRLAMMAETGQKVKLDRRIMSQLAQAGVSAQALANALGVDVSKLGSMSIEADKLGAALQKALVENGAGALENMQGDMATIKAKIGEGITSLFEGMSDAVGPFMAEIRSLFSEFYKGATGMTVAGGVLRSMLSAVFDVLTRVANIVHRVFLMAQIAVLTLAIYLAPIVNWFRAIFANAQVLMGLKVLLAVILIPFVVLGAVLLGIVMVVGLVVGAFATLIGLIVSGVSWIIGALGSLASAAWEVASGFISGLVGGITAGVGRVVGAVTSLASSAVAAVKGVLQQQSPSRVMMQIGGYTAEGFAQGMEKGGGRVAGAASGMAAEAPAAVASTASQAGAAGGGKAGAGGSMQVTFAPGAIQISGAGKDALAITEEMLATVLERLAAAQGLVTA